MIWPRRECECVSRCTIWGKLAMSILDVHHDWMEGYHLHETVVASVSENFWHTWASIASNFTVIWQWECSMRSQEEQSWSEDYLTEELIGAGYWIDFLNMNMRVVYCRFNSARVDAARVCVSPRTTKPTTPHPAGDLATWWFWKYICSNIVFWHCCFPF